MPALVVFESDDFERLSASLISQGDFQQSMQGFSPSEGYSEGDERPASVHWPMLSHLPSNTLFAPDFDAKDAFRRFMSWAKFNHYEVLKAVAFNVSPQWHGHLSKFEHGKPAKSFDEIK